MDKWERNAWSFIWTQKIDELRKAIARYPYSDRLQQRKTELEDLVRKLGKLGREDKQGD
jgi:hypothetical protein